MAAKSIRAAQATEAIQQCYLAEVYDAKRVVEEARVQLPDNCSVKLAIHPRFFNRSVRAKLARGRCEQTGPADLRRRLQAQHQLRYAAAEQ